MSGPIETFAGLRLAVIGDVMLDHYMHGEAGRISPEAPVPVVRCTSERSTPGGAGHSARSAAALGATVEVVGLVGRDEAARLLREALGADAVAARLVVAGDRPTIRKTRVFAGQHHVARVDHELLAPLTGELEEELAEAAAAVAAGADGVLVSDYAKGVVTARVMEAIVAAAKGPVVVDPKGSAWERYRGAHALTPNTSELALAAGTAGDRDDDVTDAAIRMSELLRPAALLLTRGARGMSLYVDGRHVADDASRARQVSDVTGAGDTVAACVALAAAAGMEVSSGMHWANVAAGVVVERPGTAVVTAEELDRALRA
ncbi:MAG: D-glycero-beta-D-manno-heptose-7-phosphate kinase [Thermoleophilaceae bacterium]|nr:D-glycero-beta-D-manno-heptose-7-phosphate kinase [Thermoleophilaceae bacterium]